MDLDLVFVGTAASVPSKARGLASALIRRGGERLLLDCGEGTQRQLMRSVGLGEIDAVLITHLHADHVLGLPGMLKTFGLRERTEPLVVTGPRGLNRFWKDMRPVIGRLPYEVVPIELAGGGIAWRGDGYEVEAIETQHGVPSVGYRLVEEDRPGQFDVAEATRLGVTPGADFGVLQRGGDVVTASGETVRSEQVVGTARMGRTIVYTGDTAACSAVRDASRDATVLVHEATFVSADADRAHETNHATALDAALTAAAANVGMLALTHISTRYPPRELADEARNVFEHTVVARDFDLIELPLPERGEPRFVPSGGRPRRDPAADRPTYADEQQPAG